MERYSTTIIAALAVVDIITLIVTLIIALNQGAALDEAIARGCHNAGALIQKNEQDLQQSTPRLYRTFFPDIPATRLHQIIVQQRTQLRQENTALANGCTPEQLRVAPNS
jgi:type II secretory pathway component PulL